jgi:4-carboxymuconolactone decarboxylase
MDELTEQGLTLFSEIRGAERAADMREAIGKGAFGSAVEALAVGFVVGTVWTRPGLDRKQRSLVTLGILIALRQTEEFKNHVRIGLTNGLRERDRRGFDSSGRLCRLSGRACGQQRGRPSPA